MKAVVYRTYGGPDVLEMAELPQPVPGATEVLVEVGASGLNPVDTYFRSGVREVDAFPYIPHFDLAGTVVAVGQEVSKWQVGDKVWGTNIKGTSAEFVAVPEDKLFSLPSYLSAVDGAALAMAFMTAHLALFARAKLVKGETVLIFGGAGAVGHAAIQLAKVHGATVITTAGDDDKAKIAKEAGADHVILYKKQNVTEAVLDLTKGQGVSVILDMSVSENLDADLDMIVNGGRIVTIGSPKNNAPTLPWRKLNMKNAALLGVLLFTAPKADLDKAGIEISSLFADKKLKTHVGKVFTFEEAAQAHEALEAKQFNGTIVLTP
ncbi:NADPH:quinone reductase [Bacillus alkalicellulosilyticus]|uniref:NADPH:quinone reductase n=1 Tax=Alkalihalobacterium alkalicellulosilyticum TaxID=1912214 RepID=UPI000997A79B|nr:NADPH:quinone reductase [Bacillus alkalicellulosilyticus]